MPAVARLGDPISCGDTIGQGSGNVFVNGLPATRTNSDLTVGHCYVPTKIISSSPTAKTNDKEIALVGDKIIPHRCKNSQPHDGVISVGSPDVIFGETSGTPAAAIEVTPEQAEATVNELAPDKQSGADPYIAAIHDADDEGAPTHEGDVVPYTTRGSGYVAAAVKDNNVRTNPSNPIDITTPPTPINVTEDGPTTKIPPNTPVDNSSYDYKDIDAMTGAFPGSFPLSPNFTLAKLTTNTLVSNYTLAAQSVAGVMYTEKDIVKHLRDLCYNILEPLKQQYSTLNINSGFRRTINAKSQHEKGQAVDISFPGLTTNSSAAFARAQELVASTLPYDQFIFEQNNTIWFHISYIKGKGRRDVRTKPRGTEKCSPGLFQVA